jgi:hypothetical protein
LREAFQMRLGAQEIGLRDHWKRQGGNREKSNSRISLWNIPFLYDRSNRVEQFCLLDKLARLELAVLSTLHLNPLDPFVDPWSLIKGNVEST